MTDHPDVDKYPWMELFMGEKFALETFSPGQVDMHDIAHSLSMSCRYGGHCQEFYSVAEHSVIMAEWMLETYGDARLAYQALFHDATECYLVDMPRPLKYKLLEDGITWFRDTEEHVWQIIVKAFGPKFLDPVLDPRIKEADGRIIRDERAQNMNPSDNHWSTDQLDPLGVVLCCWTPRLAEVHFLQMESKLRKLILDAGR